MTHGLTLVQQNDTHAHVEPHWEVRWRAGRPEAWRAGVALTMKGRDRTAAREFVAFLQPPKERGSSRSGAGRRRVLARPFAGSEQPFTPPITASFVSTPDPDPRNYLAAERTMLAWLRTGVAVMGFGFVVARFGLFLRLMAAQTGVASARTLSPYLGAGLVGLGVIATAGGAVEYHRFVAALPMEERERFANTRFVLFLAISLVALGVILGIELVR